MGPEEIIMGNMGSQLKAWDKTDNSRGLRLKLWARKLGWEIKCRDKPSWQTEKGNGAMDILMKKGIWTSSPGDTSRRSNHWQQPPTLATNSSTTTHNEHTREAKEDTKKTKKQVENYYNCKESLQHRPPEMQESSQGSTRPRVVRIGI